MGQFDIIQKDKTNNLVENMLNETKMNVKVNGVEKDFDNHNDGKSAKN